VSGDGRLERDQLAFERDFFQMPNDWARGPDMAPNAAGLSLRAIGLLAQLLSHKPGYVVTFKTLARKNREGDAAIRTVVDELKSKGFLEIEKQRNRRGVITGSIWRLTDPVEVEKRKRSQPVLPGLGHPHVDSPHAGNHSLKEAQQKEDSYPGTSIGGSTRAGKKEDALTGDDLIAAIWETCPVTHSAHVFDIDDGRQDGWCTFCAQVKADGSVYDRNGGLLRAATRVGSRS
jgi:hypothetical protein